MSFQNIHKKNTNTIDVRIDTSEYFDFTISNEKIDDEHIHNNTITTLNSLKLNINLSNHQIVKNNVVVKEINEETTFVFDYDVFVEHFGENYTNLILHNHVYVYNENETLRYFKIIDYNTILDVDNTHLNYFTTYHKCYEELENEPCCGRPPTHNVLPYAFSLECDDLKPRNENGWTIDFIFNRNNNEFTNMPFYYLGCRGEDDPKNYLDNNLSFAFTEDGSIKITKIHYVYDCGVESAEIETLITQNLCVQEPDKDFNLTFIFTRYRTLNDCQLLTEGGIYDLITSRNTINSPVEIMKGADESYENTFELNKKWFDEKYKRLGRLKIYLNGLLLTVKENWEEIIPSQRGVQPFIMSLGGGTPLMEGLHDGICNFIIKNVSIYDEPLKYQNLKNLFKTNQINYDIENCYVVCEDNLSSINIGLIIDDENNFINTDENYLLEYKI